MRLELWFIKYIPIANRNPGDVHGTKSRLDWSSHEEEYGAETLVEHNDYIHKQKKKIQSIETIWDILLTENFPA